jgi:hypothetical protein
MTVIIPVDDFNQKQYTFWFDDRTSTLYLDSYWENHRETKRHHWTTTRGYDRLKTHIPYTQIPLSEVAFTDEIKDLAKKTFIDTVIVKLWERR